MPVSHHPWSAMFRLRPGSQGCLCRAAKWSAGAASVPPPECAAPAPPSRHRPTPAATPSHGRSSPRRIDRGFKAVSGGLPSHSATTATYSVRTGVRLTRIGTGGCMAAEPSTPFLWNDSHRVCSPTHDGSTRTGTYWRSRATTAMRSAMTCATAARHPRSRPEAAARYSTRSANRSIRCGHGLSASLAISRSNGASPPDMTSSPTASWDSSCSDASASGRGLSTGPSSSDGARRDSCPSGFGRCAG